jgi:hypothetical protein
VYKHQWWCNDDDTNLPRFILLCWISNLLLFLAMIVLVGYLEHARLCTLWSR